MTENEIREQLNSYRKAVLDIKAAMHQICELGDRATASGSLAPKKDRVISSPALQARFAEAIEEKADLERIVADEIERLAGERKKVESIIALAPSVMARIVLTRFYIDGESNVRIAESMHYEVRTIKRIKRRAIQKMSSSCHPEV